jgi:hypothetical protein
LVEGQCFVGARDGERVGAGDSEGVEDGFGEAVGMIPEGLTETEGTPDGTVSVGDSLGAGVGSGDSVGLLLGDVGYGEVVGFPIEGTTEIVGFWLGLWLGNADSVGLELGIHDDGLNEGEGDGADVGKFGRCVEGTTLAEGIADGLRSDGL